MPPSYIAAPLIGCLIALLPVSLPAEDDAPKLEEGKPTIALRLEAKEERGSVRITVFLENLTDKPIKLRDTASPAFSPWPWL